MVLLDIKAAYPPVAHKLLIHTLSNIGMQNHSLNWIRSFIFNKKEYVEIGNQKSDLRSIECGLLQGDNLSQIFFSLIINGVTEQIKSCKYHLYADDQSIYIHSSLEKINNNLELINKDIDCINNWMIKNGMALNPTKTQAIIIASEYIRNKISKLSMPKIKVGTAEIDYSNQVKYLGFHFNNNFDSKNHVDKIIQKVNFTLNKINHCKRNIPEHAKQEIINGVVLPIFDYGSFIYHGHRIYGTLKDQKRIQLAQNICVRFIKKVSGFSRISPILNNMKKLNMYHRLEFLILCFVHKLIYFDSAPYLSDIFIKNNNTTRAGQDSYSLKIGKAVNNKEKHIFSHCVAQLWNSVPSKIRNINSHNLFRNEIHNFLLNKQIQKP